MKFAAIPISYEVLLCVESILSLKPSKLMCGFGNGENGLFGVGAPYTVRSFIIYDNDVTLLLFDGKIGVAATQASRALKLNQNVVPHGSPNP